MDIIHFLDVSKKIKISLSTFFLDQSKIPLVEQCKYLGTTISIKNSDLDLKRQMRKLYANANLLLRNVLDDQSVSNVTCLRLTALIYFVHLCGLIVQKQC